VYVIRNFIKDKIYIGHTSDLKNRLKRHNGILKNNPESFTSKNTGIWRLMYKEEFNTRQEAIIREKQLKSYQGRKFIKNIIKERDDKQNRLSR
jgi:putative endonuclease